MQGFTGKGIFGAFADVGEKGIWAHQRRGPIVPNMRTQSRQAVVLFLTSTCQCMVQDDKTDLNTFGVHRTIHRCSIDRGLTYSTWVLALGGTTRD